MASCFLRGFWPTVDVLNGCRWNGRMVWELLDSLSRAELMLNFIGSWLDVEAGRCIGVIEQSIRLVS